MVALPIHEQQSPVISVLPAALYNLSDREITALHYLLTLPGGRIQLQTVKLATHGFSQGTLIAMSMATHKLIVSENSDKAWFDETDVWFAITDAGRVAAAMHPLPEPPLVIVRKETPTRGNCGFWGRIHTRGPITHFGYEDKHLRSTRGDWNL